MNVLPILQIPRKILKQKAKPVRKITPEITTLIEDMQYTLAEQKDPSGVGLAAPQVGKSLQLFIVRQVPDQAFKVFINPTVTLLASKNNKKSKIKSEPDGLEGCLSVRRLWGVVERTPEVFVKYLDEDEYPHASFFFGFEARIIQHEYDHLQGILFPMRVLDAHGDLFREKINKKGESILTSIGKSFNI